MIKQEKSLLQQALSHVVAIVIFIAITVIYFGPLVDGKTLPQGDVKQYQGASKEIRDYYNNEGESSTWTGSMFSGMPSYQIAVFGGSINFLDYLEMPVKAIGGSNAGAVFMGMLMAYILFCVLGVKPSVAVLGAIAYSLSSYNIIIIEAGHVTKAWALAYLPLVVAGMMVMFKRKYLLGGILFALGLALQIKSNHLQITFYTGLLCLFLYIGLVIETVRKAEIKNLLKASGILAVAVVLAGLCNVANTYANYEMSKESTRGKSELTTPSASEKQSSGLDKDYAFAWSYGKAETFSLLVPNIHGGASGGMLDKSSNLAQEMTKQGYGSQIGAKGIQAYTYWGDQPFTSGPVYFGAIICFLFVLGMFIIRSNLKWVLFAATILFIFLSWGRNMEWFNDLFFYHFPMYNKFRTVSMALVIPALTMIMIAVWGLTECLSGEIDKKKLTKSIYISVGIVGGLSLFFWIAPGFFFNFTAESDLQWKSQMPDWFYNALLADRKDILSSDAFRSLLLILLSGGVLWAMINTEKGKQKTIVMAVLAIAFVTAAYMLLGDVSGLYIAGVIILLAMVIGIGQLIKVDNMMIPATVAIFTLLILGDLWSVDKRYLNSENFVSKATYEADAFKKTVADQAILQDKHPSYRVLNLSNPFNESGTSYYHKSIGGYHAAKLKRYQELIDNRLQQEVAFVQQRANDQLKKAVDQLNAAQQQGQEVTGAEIPTIIQDSVSPLLQVTTALNMLNAKYIVYHPELPPVQNPYALGNAWFVHEYKFVDNADAEIASIETLNPLKTAVVDKRFESELANLTIIPDSTATMQMVEYKPNRLKYKAKVATEQLAVMSEIYYANGWKAYIDGAPASHFRADWTLRAMRIPAGEHDIEFVFEPDTYNEARMIVTASSAILVLLTIGFVVMLFVRKEENDGINHVS